MAQNLEGKKRNSKSRLSSSFRLGAISITFLIIGYQVALFVHSAAVESIVATHDRPDTVWVESRSLSSSKGEVVRQAHQPERSLSQPERSLSSSKGQSRRSERPPHVDEVLQKAAPKKAPETFRFNPNTVSIEDLMRLGFSRKQAESIDNYRAKGGQYRRKTDFAKSFVVSEEMYDRLKDHIDIPLLDINAADSAAFDALPGIGPYFASKMVSYRQSLSGYSRKEQLMEIWNFDKARFDALQDLITVGPCDSLRFWGMSIDELKKHPYVRTYNVARSIVFFREHNPRSNWTFANLASAGILPDSTALKLSLCRIKTP